MGMADGIRELIVFFNSVRKEICQSWETGTEQGTYESEFFETVSGGSTLTETSAGRLTPTKFWDLAFPETSP
jgi:hypothetical protein